ncbi:MAG: bla [Candidatus Midichloriaceae bacterium]|jgi:beta-lactamase class A|nr:bla [Candidatus Midichloriaceae bacterium]
MKQASSYIAKLIIVMTLSFYGSISNAHTEDNFLIIKKLKKLESSTEGRLGIFAINTKNGHIIKYRSDEIFPTGCTSKVIGVAVVLKKSMLDPSLLSQNIKYSKKDLDAWAPITKQYVSKGMTVRELCAASISFSDNTAMNLLLRSIGGIQGMNDFARSIGDPSFRQDSDWPEEAFSGGAGNLKDTSTPQAMVESFHKLTIGDVLERPHRDLFTAWLINSQTSTARIHAGIPKGWIIGNKTGTGAVYGSTNDIAIVWPPKHEPILIGVYYTSDNKKAKKREDIVAAATKALIEEFINMDKTLTADIK